MQPVHMAKQYNNKKQLRQNLTISEYKLQTNQQKCAASVQ